MAEEAQQAAVVESNDTEAQEWADANKDFSVDKGLDPAKPVVEEPKKPEGPAKPEEGGEAATQTDEEKKAAEDKAASEKAEADKKAAEEAEAEKAKSETPEETKARHEKEAEEAKKAEAEAAKIPDDPRAREYRSAQRAMQEDKKAVIADVKEKMFSDIKTELTDADGEPIRTVADVMKLLNPNTGQAFTAEEATIYLFEAQKHLENTLKETEQKVEEIAEVNLSLKDQADSVRTKYGEILKGMPQLADELHQEFMETLVRDDETGIIISAPISLEKFYTRALRPYAEHLSKLEADTEEEAKAEAKRKADEEAKRAQADRGDIYSGGKTETMDNEEKEWAEAAKRHYEG